MLCSTPKCRASINYCLCSCLRLTQQEKQQPEPAAMNHVSFAVSEPIPNTNNNTSAASFSVECSDMSCTEDGMLKGITGFGPDPAEVTSPVKRTPMPDVPPNDGFHRTFQPFHMLRSPTSLGGQSFHDLNTHLAQNAKLSTRQRSLRHALRTATKEYVTAEEPVVTGVKGSLLLAFHVPYPADRQLYSNCLEYMTSFPPPLVAVSVLTDGRLCILTSSVGVPNAVCLWQCGPSAISMC